MKLYAFYPSSHGQYSFFVAAENEKAAFGAVDKHIKDNHMMEYGNGAYDYIAEGWGTDYYKVVEVEPGQVLENGND